MKIVIDTNVYISGIFWEGKPRDILRLAKKDLIHVFISKKILDEIKDVITREDKPFKLSNDEVEKILKDILKYATIVSPTKTINAINDDPQDNKVLECAVEAHANLMISGDPHLKNLKEYNNIKIISPSVFLEMVK